MNSPTMVFQASITSLSRKRSLNPSCCMSFGSRSPGACQRSGRVLFAGSPRHSATTAARSDAFMKKVTKVKSVTTLQSQDDRCNHVTVLQFNIDAKRQYFRRMLLGRIFSSVRYLATVRRAIGMPRSLRISTISLSLSGEEEFSSFTRSKIASFTLVLLIDSPLEV